MRTNNITSTQNRLVETAGVVEILSLGIKIHFPENF